MKENRFLVKDKVMKVVIDKHNNSKYASVDDGRTDYWLGYCQAIRDVINILNGLDKNDGMLVSGYEALFIDLKSDLKGEDK